LKTSLSVPFEFVSRTIDLDEAGHNNESKEKKEDELWIEEDGGGRSAVHLANVEGYQIGQRIAKIKS
jgi:hypothetical protein